MDMTQDRWDRSRTWCCSRRRLRALIPNVWWRNNSPGTGVPWDLMDFYWCVLGRPTLPVYVRAKNIGVGAHLHHYRGRGKSTGETTVFGPKLVVVANLCLKALLRHVLTSTLRRVRNLVLVRWVEGEKQN